MKNFILMTRDIDFLIENPKSMRLKVNIPELLKDLGFIVSFTGSQGYIKLSHEDLILEFLVPEKGRGVEGPVPLPSLGMNAVALRFLIIKALIANNGTQALRDAFHNVPVKWQKKIIEGLKFADEPELLEIITESKA